MKIPLHGVKDETIRDTRSYVALIVIYVDSLEIKNNIDNKYYKTRGKKMDKFRKLINITVIKTMINLSN